MTSSDGKPVDAIRVDLADADHWELESAPRESAYTDAAGFFRFEGIPPGPAQLVVIEDASGGVGTHARLHESTYTDQRGHIDFLGFGSRAYVVAIWSRQRGTPKRLTATEPFMADRPGRRLRVVLPRPVLQ